LEAANPRETMKYIAHSTYLSAKALTVDFLLVQPVLISANQCLAHKLIRHLAR
jgi:hypothetical protein